MSDIGGSAVHMRISSEPTRLPIVRAALGKLCEQADFDAETTGQIILSVDEALTNIIRHAYDGAADRPIEIEFAIKTISGEVGLDISLRDYGKVVDPTKIKSRDLDDVRPGGLGVHIMRKCMDEVQYTQAEGGGTCLRMFKKLMAAQEDCPK